LESCAKDINFDELNNPMWTKFECEEWNSKSVIKSQFQMAKNLSTKGDVLKIHCHTKITVKLKDTIYL
jgi:hypothetical protein